MASSLARRAAAASASASMERSSNSLFRQSFNFLLRNNLSTTSSATTPANPTTVAAEKPKRKKKKNLFEVAQFLPNWGIGYHMAKTHWSGVSYQITKINLYKVSLSLFPSTNFYFSLLLYIYVQISVSVISRVYYVIGFFLQDGRHGKAWGIVHKEGQFFIYLLLLFPHSTSSVLSCYYSMFEKCFSCDSGGQYEEDKN